MTIINKTFVSIVLPINKTNLYYFAFILNSHCGSVGIVFILNQ